MTAEAWPTEDAATRAVEAVARKFFEAQRAAILVDHPGAGLATWDELPANDKVTVKNGVLTLVWTAIEALPDPRHGAWAEGHQRGMEDERAHLRNISHWTPENPYPSELS